VLWTLLAAAGSPRAAAQDFSRAASAVSARAVAARSIVRPGDQLVIAVAFRHAAGFHTWPHTPIVPVEFRGVIPIPTNVEVISVPEGTEVRPFAWPLPEPVTVYYTGSPVELLSYVGTAVAYLPLVLPGDLAPGELTVELRTRYQTCDERLCYPPQTVALEIPLQVVAAEAAVRVGTTEPELFAGFDLEAFTPTADLRPPPVSMNVFGWSFTFDAGGPAGMALLLLLAALGGLVLNLTPCVLPVIPLKIMGLSRAAGDPTRLLLLGTVMSLGVVAFWVVLGAAIAFVAGFDAISSLFQTGWFAPLVGVVVAVMGLGMMGLFTLRLPQRVYRIDPGQETVAGSFGFGVMTAILSTPCTAPFMAGASAWAALQAPAVTLSTFGAIGVGMALPYQLLAARPALLQRLPRVGPASVLIKQTLGIVMLAVAAFFLGSAVSAWLQRPPQPASRAYWWVVAGLLVAACGWVAYRTISITRDRTRRFVVGGVSAGLAVTTVLLAQGLTAPGPIDWTYYTPQQFQESALNGEVIVLDFTAEWCLNCKALEAGVLHRPEIVELLAQPDVVPMRVDLTSDNPPGRAKLAELGWVGIPLLAVYGPATGYDDPQKFDSYTPQVVLDAVDRAGVTALE
jgi:thiol:disulfide interchange protein DsbD